MSGKSRSDAFRRCENTEVYRFLWLRTFRHPVAVTLERNVDHFELRSVELDGAGGYAPGKILSTGRKSITQEVWCQFTGLLDKAAYWKIPSNSRDDMGYDGSQWILEGIKDGRYHIVDRWTPQTGEYREACLFVLKLSGRSFENLKKDLY